MIDSGCPASDFWLPAAGFHFRIPASSGRLPAFISGFRILESNVGVHKRCPVLG